MTMFVSIIIIKYMIVCQIIIIKYMLDTIWACFIKKCEENTPSSKMIYGLDMFAS